MDATQVEQEIGKVRRRVVEWELQILLASSSGHVRDAYQIYTQLPPGAVKDRVGEAILKGERHKDRLEDIVNSFFTPVTTTIKSISACTPRKRCHVQDEDATKSDLAPFTCTDYTDKSVLKEIARIAEEKGLPEISALALEKREWREVLEKILIQIKNAKIYSKDLNELRKKVVCFNCEKKGHIVKYCPTRCSKNQGKGAKNNK